MRRRRLFYNTCLILIACRNILNCCYLCFSFFLIHLILVSSNDIWLSTFLFLSSLHFLILLLCGSFNDILSSFLISWVPSLDNIIFNSTLFRRFFFRDFLLLLAFCNFSIFNFLTILLTCSHLNPFAYVCELLLLLRTCIQLILNILCLLWFLMFRLRSLNSNKSSCRTISNYFKLLTLLLWSLNMLDRWTVCNLSSLWDRRDTVWMAYFTRMSNFTNF